MVVPTPVGILGVCSAKDRCGKAELILALKKVKSEYPDSLADGVVVGFGKIYPVSENLLME
jgi:hypothetical protein